MAKIRFSPLFFLSSILIVLSILLILFGSFAGNSLFMRELLNTGHTLLFILMTVALMVMLRHPGVMDNQHPMWPYMAAAALSFSIGLILEIGQLYTSRDASFLDIARNTAGITIGLCVYALTDYELKTRWLKQRGVATVVIVLLVFIMFVVSMMPIVLLGTAYIQRNMAFPTLLDLRANWSKPFIQLKHAMLIPIHDDRASTMEGSITREITQPRLVLLPAQYPGISLVAPYPDWSAYDMLTVDVYWPGPEPVELVLRIHDEQHNHDYSDRFNQILTVVQGENRFHIPLKDIKDAPRARSMDMGHIANVTLFSVDTDSEQVLYPGRLYLD